VGERQRTAGAPESAVELDGRGPLAGAGIGSSPPARASRQNRGDADARSLSTRAIAGPTGDRRRRTNSVPGGFMLDSRSVVRSIGAASLALGCALAAPESLSGQAAGAAAPPACTSAEHRQFDFWVGDWEVRGPRGNVAGRNRIARILGGCVLQERWEGASGSRGESYNIYDASRRTWHQTWVDDGGTLLTFEGEFRGGMMELTGRSLGADGKQILQRMRFQPRGADELRQRREQSTD
jgi:hypothetical protein